MEFNMRVWSIILKKSDVENNEKFRNVSIWMCLKLKFVVEFWNRIIYWKFEKLYTYVEECPYCILHVHIANSPQYYGNYK